MEHGFRPQEKGLTQLTFVQVVHQADEPYCVTSVDHFLAKGIPLRLTGLALDSESRFFSLLHKQFSLKESFRFYSVFVEGGDLKPQPKNEEEFLQKKVILLDGTMNSFLRNLVAKVLNLSLDRDAVVGMLSDRPELLNDLWQHPLFQHIHAIFWQANVTFLKGQKLSSIRLVTARDLSLVRHVECNIFPDLTWNDISFLPYGTKEPCFFDAACLTK